MYPECTYTAAKSAGTCACGPTCRRAWLALSQDFEVFTSRGCRNSGFTPKVPHYTFPLSHLNLFNLAGRSLLRLWDPAAEDLRCKVAADIVGTPDGADANLYISRNASGNSTFQIVIQ